MGHCRGWDRRAQCLHGVRGAQATNELMLKEWPKVTGLPEQLRSGREPASCLFWKSGGHPTGPHDLTGVWATVRAFLGHTVKETTGISSRQSVDSDYSPTKPCTDCSGVLWTGPTSRQHL